MGEEEEKEEKSEEDEQVGEEDRGANGGNDFRRGRYPVMNGRCGPSNRNNCEHFSKTPFAFLYIWILLNIAYHRAISIRGDFA